MYTIGEFERINEEFIIRQNSRKQTLKKIWGTLLIVTIIICGVLIFLFPGQFENEGTVWIMPVYGGMAFLASLIGFLVTLQFLSEKPFFEYLYEEVVSKINMNEGLFLEYSSYDKVSKEFNTTGGLFTRMASVKSRRQVQGVTSDQYHFSIYDCTMTTSSGKSQQTHFDGVYFVLKKKFNTSLQVRSNGSPKLKGIKFAKLDEYTGIKVYKQPHEEISNLDYKLIHYVENLLLDPIYKRVYLSVIEGELHLALWYKKHPARKLKSLSVDSLNSVYSYLLSEVKQINDLANIEVY